MNNRVLLGVSVSMAVIAAAISAIIVTNNRTKLAHTRAAAAESRAKTAAAEAKLADANARKAEANRRAAEDLRIKETNAVERAKLERALAHEERLKAEAEEKIAREDAECAAQEAEIARAEAQKEKAEAEQLKAAAAQAAAEAQMTNAAAQIAFAQLSLEERRSAAAIAEAKLLELRKLDLEGFERGLMEWQNELREREQALMPDPSIFDSTNVEWVADGEAIVLGADSNRLLRARAPVLDENNRALPLGTRLLAKKSRLARARLDAAQASTRELIVSRLARLYVAALRDGRVIDAEFYLKSIRLQDPQWDPAAYIKKEVK